MQKGFLTSLIYLPFVFGIFSFGDWRSGEAQLASPSSIPQDREIHNTFTPEEKKGSILDATNPMELLNRLKRATAMENATPPSDAIDDALKAFNESSMDQATPGNLDMP